MLSGVMPCSRFQACLLLAPAGGLGHRPLHRAGDAVGVQHHAAVDVARRPADGLDEGRLRAQEPLLVGVQDGHQAALGNVQPLAQQIDADQHVERAQAQVADDLDAFERVDVAVHVAHAQALLVHVFAEVLGHLLGQHGDQGCDSRAAANSRHSAITSSTWLKPSLETGPHLDRRVDQAGGADHLFDEHAAGLFQLPLRRAWPLTNTLSGRIASHSSNFSGRLSRQDGRRKPYSDEGEFAVVVALGTWPPAAAPSGGSRRRTAGRCRGCIRRRSAAVRPGRRPVR